MSKIVKYFLVAAALTLVAVAVIAAYLVATFDPNAYKPQAVQWIKEKTGRTLALPGDVELVLFPPVGISVGKATLSEPGSDAVFASVEQLRLSLELLALLHRQVRIDEVRIQGLRANLVRGVDGRLNVDDLLGVAGAPPAEQQGAASATAKRDFAIDSIALVNGALTYRDEKTHARYAVSELDVETGRIAPNQPGTVDFSGRVQSAAPKLDLAVQGKSGFAFDGDGKRFAAQDLALEAKGAAADVTDLAVKVRGGVKIDQATRAFEVAKLAITASGNRNQEAFELDVALPRLRLTQSEVGGEQLTAKAALRRAGGTVTSANLAVPKLEGSADAFRIADAVLDIDAVRPAQTLRATLTGPVEGRLAEGSLAPALVGVKPLSLQAALSGPHVPKQSVTGTLQGSATVDFVQQRAHLDLAGVFDQSTIKAKVGAAGFSPPGYSFDVEIDQLDLTRYQSPPAAAAAPAPDAKPPAEVPIDLSALRDLNAHGSIRIGALKAPKLKASNVRIEVKAQDGRVDLDPLAANLYGGSLTGAVGVNAQGTPELTVKQALAGVNIGPLLADLAKFDRLEGRGNFSVNVSTTGETVSELKKGLNGTAAANLSNGAIKGIDIAATIRAAKATIGQLKGKQLTEAADTTQQTDFTELKATFTIRHGIASNRDLTGKSPLLRLAGEGDIDLGNERMNYLLKANLVESLTGQSGKERIQIAEITVPVRVTGPLDAPSYTFDFAAMAADLAQQALQQELQRKLGSKLPGGLPADILQEAVKGLFKR